MIALVTLLAFAGAVGAFLIGAGIPGLVALVGRRARGMQVVEEAPAPTAILQSLSRPFEGLAARQQQRAATGGAPTLTDELSRAGLKIKGSEWIAIQAGCALVLFGFTLAWFQISLLPIIFGVLGWFAPRLYLSYRKRRRLALFHDQLVDTVNLLASSLRAGHSLPQAMEMVAETGLPPISEEFSRVMHELDVGSPLDAALENMVRRIRSEDMEIIATAAIIHHHAGGNLAATLETISDTIRDRIRVRGEISAMTAQARASAIFITLLPFILAGLILFLDKGYFNALFSNVIGYVAIGYCAVSIFVGNLIIRRIVNVEI
jgi:tight adherence protein B